VMWWAFNRASFHWLARHNIFELYSFTSTRNLIDSGRRLSDQVGWTKRRPD
jgi:hypothetical protein